MVRWLLDKNNIIISESGWFSILVRKEKITKTWTIKTQGQEGQGKQGSKKIGPRE